MDDDTTPPVPLVVRRISSAQTHDLRSRVLRPGYPIEACMFEGDDDARTIHAAAFAGDRIASIASMYLEPRPEDVHEGTWRLRGMATEPDLRRRGAGAMVLAHCTAHAVEHGASLLWCNARVGAVDFYLQQGWIVIGDEFDIPTVGPHVVMERSLA